MRTHDSTPDELLTHSVAMRSAEVSDARRRDLEIGRVTVQSGALYLGPRSGTNGESGVVVRVPNGAYPVVATIDDTAGVPRLVAISVALGGDTVTARDGLPGGAYWHDDPGLLPILDGDALAVSDAAVRDQHHTGGFPWDGWLHDVVDPALAEARADGRVAAEVTYPGRPEAMLVTVPLGGEVTLYASFDDSGRPAALHLEALERGADAGADTPFTPEPQSARPADAESWSAAPAPATVASSPFSAPPSNDWHTPESATSAAVEEPPSLFASSSTPVEVPPVAATPALDVVEPLPSEPQTSAFGTPDAGDGLTEIREAVAASERRDLAAAIPGLERGVEHALATGPDGDDYRRSLAAEQLSPAYLVDHLVDGLVAQQRADAALDVLRRALDAPTLSAAPAEQLHLRRRLGELELRAGELDRARATLETARGEAEQLTHRTGPDPDGEIEFARDYQAHIQYHLADVELQRGDAGQAQVLATESKRQFSELRHARMAGRAAFLAASAFGALGQEASRLEAIADAERLFRMGEELDGLGTALGYLGEADAQRGEYAAALVKFMEACDMLTDAGEFANAGIAAQNAAVCLEYLGDPERAAKHRAVAAGLEQRSADERADA